MSKSEENTNIADIEIRLKKYKYFQEDTTIIEKICPINIIIEKNNSGKSSFLGVAGFSCNELKVRQQ